LGSHAALGEQRDAAGTRVAGTTAARLLAWETDAGESCCPIHLLPEQDVVRSNARSPGRPCPQQRPWTIAHEALLTLGSAREPVAPGRPVQLERERGRRPSLAARAPESPQGARAAPDLARGRSLEGERVAAENAPPPISLEDDRWRVNGRSRATGHGGNDCADNAARRTHDG